MAHFDWDGNGKDDAFDTFMDMTMVSDVIEDNNDNCDDTYCEDSGCCEDEPKMDSEEFDNTTESTLSFQDELKQNLRTPEVVRNEKSSMQLKECQKQAEFVLTIIKDMLMTNAQNAVYTQQNGVTTVSCIYNLPQYFLRRTHKNNSEQLRINRKTNFLLREPNLVYRSWDTFDVEPEYSFKYYLFIICLKELAKKDNIDIEEIIREPHRDNFYPFPTDIDLAVGAYYLAVKATTRISGGNQNNKNNQNSTNTDKPKVNQELSSQEIPKEISNWSVFAIYLIVIILLVLLICGICYVEKFGKLLVSIVLIAAAIGAYHIINKIIE